MGKDWEKSVKSESRLREWATPITIGAFGFSAFTGMALFFQVDLGLTRPLHEWLSWLLVFGTLCHLIANWRLSARYASRPAGRRILLAFLVLIGASLIPFGEKHENHASMRIADALIQAPLSVVAQIAGHGPEDAIRILGQQGIRVEGKEQTIREIALKSNKPPLYLLATIF